jgi:hypothetical protein
VSRRRSRSTSAASQNQHHPDFSRGVVEIGRIFTVHNVANPDKLHAVADGVKHI